jgi:dolichol-phosphate mannosyltransferase
MRGSHVNSSSMISAGSGVVLQCPAATLAGPMRALVVLPTLNEVGTIAEVIRRVRAAAPDVEVLVVDDGSPDGTADVAEEVGREVGSVHVLRRQGQRGFASAYRDGLKWGLAHHAPVFVQMDSDLSHDPAALPELLAALETADMAIGSRYVPGGAMPHWAWHRRILSAAGNWYAGVALGLKVHDVTSGYRAFKANLLGSIDLDRSRSEGYAFLIEFTYRSMQHGYRIVEVPITFSDREMGESKMSGAIAVESLALTTRWALGRGWRKAQTVTEKFTSEHLRRRG